MSVTSDNESQSGDSPSSEGDTNINARHTEDGDSTKTLLMAYKTLSSRRVDLIGDYAGNELFLIEGDSLLLHCFSDPHLDFQDGFQILHAVYLVERFLDNLIRRKCNFHIAFIHNHRSLSVPPFASAQNSSKYLLARAIIINHLKSNMPKAHPRINVNVFESLDDEAFRTYIAEAGMYFMMCHDGARSSQSSPASQELAATGTDQETQQKLLLRSMILTFINRDFNVALINELEWRDTKALTMVLEGSRRGHNVAIPKLDVLQHVESPDSTWIEGAIDRLKAHKGLEELSYRERLVLTVSSQVLSRQKGSEELQRIAEASLLHVSILNHLPLASRCFESMPCKPETRQYIDDFAGLAEQLTSNELWTTFNEKCDSVTAIDLIDGRLLNLVADEGITKAPLASAQNDYEKLLESLNALSLTQGEDLHKVDPSATPNESSRPDIAEHFPQADGDLGVLPFANPVFDKHLESIHLSVDEMAGGDNSMASARIFREVSHWHNAKKPIAPKATVPVSAKEESWAMKRNQWFMAEMQKYAASLTNATGKALDPETVVVGASRQARVNTTSTPDGHETKPAKGKSSDSAKKGGAKASVKGGGKKQAILDSIAAANTKRDETSNEKVMQAWHVACKNFAVESDIPSRYIMVKDYLASLPKAKSTVVGSEVQLYMLNTLLERWISLCRSERQVLGLAALIWHTARTLPKEGITKTIAAAVNLTVETLQLPAIPVKEITTQDRKLPFALALPPAKAVDLSIRLPAQEFQLLHCGPYLDRSMDSAPDDRVEFEPDGWQRRVLDGIDANRSLVVVAPTSAGKTFISFYAMRKILEADDDGVLVYVAPTKALVNQIAAEIQARYSKKFKYGGKSVWAIHTRDYRINNPTGCQVLVTVPHVLQIMLLAPSHANSWSGRVKRIIFDEVHSIGNAEDGVVWEQLLLLSPCPIIALSATVGNPSEFSGWLTSTQKAIGHDLEMIQHPYRYSDLRKFYYKAPERFAFTGLGVKTGFGSLGLDGTKGFAFIHPVASLVNKSRGMPDDLHLEPRDCYTLWQSMWKHRTADFPVPSELDPAKVLKSSVRKLVILEWEKQLKDLFRSWMANEDSPFDAVLADLGEPLHQAKGEEVQLSRPAADKEKPSKINVDDILETTLPLLCSLHEQEALPAIFFNYERGLCEKICQKVVSMLKEGEDAYKASSPKWKTTLKAFEEWKAMKEKADSKKPRAAKGGAKKMSKEDREENEGDKMSKGDQQRDAGSNESSTFDRFDPDAPVEGFHFADHKKVQTSELALYLRQLGRRNVPQWLIDSVSRGIGVHHAGMNRKYRQVVEILFRKGFLRVVIATGTLALGINMPCKTVVFSGDSVFLTALNFRQGAGRAGRRGFDLLGNVVFQNITEPKVCRLLSSRLPDLNGHFPITTTLVLRLFTLLHESKNSQYAVKAINTMLSQSRLYMGGPEFKDQTLHHLRFSIEYLRRQQLLDSRGATLNFAGLVSHLYFTENSSFAFHALLKEGYLHRLCADIDEKEQNVVETLMLVMSHLFGRVFCRQSDEEYREKVVKPSSSIVFLPSLPQDAVQVLQDHSDQTLQVFFTYVQSFAHQHIDYPDDQLPLTGLRAGALSAKGDSASLRDDPFSSKALPPTTVRSHFVALSGHTDKFSSVPDLCQTTRSGVFLEESVIPHVGIYPQTLPSPLNAYLLDFYKHGDIDTLERANGIRKGDVWFLLNDFSLVLATIVTSLMNFMKLKVANDLDMLEIMGNLDSLEEAEDDKIAVAENEGEVVSVVADATVRPEKPIVSKKKDKNVDSWEDVADAEEKVAAAQDRKIKASEEARRSDMGEAAWEGAGGELGLLKVLKAFQKLHQEFNIKFRAMWA